MNAQQLLEELLNLQLAGVDLSQLEVIVPTYNYDCEGRCEEGERYPEEVNVVDDYLELR
jgi:hypothetical protein